MQKIPPKTEASGSRPPTWLELESIRPLAEVSAITSLSEDTLGRRFGDRIVRISKRRRGMKLRHALAIAAGEVEPA